MVVLNPSSHRPAKLRLKGSGHYRDVGVRSNKIQLTLIILSYPALRVLRASTEELHQEFGGLPFLVTTINA